MKARRLALRALAIVIRASVIAPASAAAASEVLTRTTANFAGHVQDDRPPLGDGVVVAHGSPRQPGAQRAVETSQEL